jgi:hypothetical protein
MAWWLPGRWAAVAGALIQPAIAGSPAHNAPGARRRAAFGSDYVFWCSAWYWLQKFYLIQIIEILLFSTITTLQVLWYVPEEQELRGSDSRESQEENGILSWLWVFLIT